MASINIPTGKVKIPGTKTSVPIIVVAGVIGLPLGVAMLYILNDQLGLGLSLPGLEMLGLEGGGEPSGPAEVVIFTINPAQTFQGSTITLAGSFLDPAGTPATVSEGYYTILEDGREIKATGSIGQNISTFNMDIPVPLGLRDGAYDLYISDHQLTAAEIASRIRVPANAPIVNLPPGQVRMVGPTPPPPSPYMPAGSIGVH